MRKRNRGQVIVIFALALFALIGLAALGVDVAFMYSVRHELQRCADAGALAGASAFLDSDWSLEDPTRIVARARARDFASRDNVVTSQLDPVAEVSVDFPVQDRIRVTTNRTVNLFFARVLGRPTQAISATAVAEAAVVNRDLPCLKPWAIPYPWNDINGDRVFQDNEAPVYKDCPEPPPATEAERNLYFCSGTEVILKTGTAQQNPQGNPDENFSSQQSPGNFFAIRFPGDNPSAAVYYDRIIEDCAPGTVSFNDSMASVNPGDMVRKTIDGAQYLINDDPGAYWDLAENTVKNSRLGDNWAQTKRVIRIPVYDPSVGVVGTGSNAQITVDAFVGFWIDRVESASIKIDGQPGNHLQGTVYGRYVDVNSLGGRGDEGPVNGPALRILRLVE